MLGGGAGLLLVPPHFCLGGGVGAAKSLLPSFLVPKGNQPTACTLALWWLKFGPTGGGGGGGVNWRVLGGGSAGGCVWGVRLEGVWGGVRLLEGGGGLRVTQYYHMHTSRGNVCLGWVWGSCWWLF